MAFEESPQFADLQRWVVDHVAGDFMKAHRLMVIESQDDPSTEPHRSQLEARKLLTSLNNCLESCPEQLRSLEEFRMVSASLQLHLGINYINTDEVAEGEKAFESCRSLLCTVSCQNRAAYLTITVLNQLGLLWCGREDYSKALDLLQQASEVYRACEGQPIPLTDKEWLEGECKEERERGVALEDLHTHTLFYIAQVYGHLKELKLSADYCRTTLCRQLYTRHFDPIEWCFNAATISQYYQNVGNLAQARHCLACCWIVLPMAHKELVDSGDSEDEELMEKVRKTEADMSRCWVKYCLTLLRKSSELQNSKEEESLEKINEEELYKFDPLASRLEEDQVTCELVHDYPTARAVFLFGQKHVLQAQKFFTMESYTSDNISLAQDHSQLFRLLSLFQSDDSMKCRMHKRRVDMLSSILDEINQKCYPVEAKRLSHELGEVFKEMSDIKIDQGGEKPSPHAVSKINMLLQKGIGYYEHFMDLYRDPQGKLPSSFDQQQVTAVLAAQLNKGRMLTALITSPQEEVRNIARAIDLYEWIVRYHAAHKKDIGEELEESVLFCKDMIELLPQKVALLRRQCQQ